jgi:hypothetical protein
MFLWLIVVAAVTALAWWWNPQPRAPDLSAFEDGGRAVVKTAPVIEDVPRTVSVHWSVALRMLPVIGGFLVVSVAAGLFFRERARYASPTLAWIGKRTALGSVALLALFVLAPLGWGLWTPYAAGAAAGTGIAIYAGNLPGRL